MARLVLGVDPGSSATGWALISGDGNRHQLQAYGVVRPRGTERAERLADLDRRFSLVVTDTVPDCAAVESPFSGRNPKSALSLAECRGVILAALGRHGVATWSYPPAEIKSAIVGHGTALKQQVAYMVTHLLSLDSVPPADAADAMAVALTHLQTKRW